MTDAPAPVVPASLAQRLRSGGPVAFMIATVLFAALAGIVCFGQPDLLAALTLVPPWCWLIGGLGSAAILGRIEYRRPAQIVALLWLAFAIVGVEEGASLARSIIGG